MAVEDVAADGEGAGQRQRRPAGPQWHAARGDHAHPIRCGFTGQVV